MSKRILVTGAGGYIGRHVVKTLLNQGYEVGAADITTNEIDSRAEKYTCDIFSGDPDIYHKLGTPDICIHLAWQDGFIHNSVAHINNLPKHYKFVQDMIEGGLKHISIMGTMHEIGYWEGEIDENTPTNPSSLYGITKNAFRQMISSLINQNEDIIFQWIRAFYIYGDDMKNNSLFSKIIQSEKEGKTTFPFNSGKNKYDFISVQELALQISLASTQSEVTGIVNCCTGEPIALKDKVEEFIQQNNFKVRPDYGVFPDRPYDSPIVWGNNDKIKAIMNK